MAETSQGDTTPARIGAHYRVEAELGQGGMARVFRVRDERTNARFALKQLMAAGDRAATMRAMFEREYHTLTDLAHPHIVHVFDYGLDAGNPFYTMELLEGVDAREAALDGKLDVSQICLLLRDCASALALIHSRRMVHRDLSPRNVWCSPNGRAKLIDFGTLVAMGAETRVAGTPPFMPPEALNAQPLDARCDLYALGALGYLLLTGRNAYPARTLADLPYTWQRRPPAPDTLRADLPSGLSDLLMTMLNLDARGRPPSAAEVYERLSAIASLPAESEQLLAQAFLTSPKLVGRELASAALIKRVQRASRRRGSSVAIVARAGLGRSRMLADAVLNAKLTGATTVTVSATAVGSSSLALASALVERLLEAQPALALLATDNAGLLAQLSPALQHMLGDPPLVPLTAFERTRKLSAAIISLFDLVSQRQSLVLAVDDVHRADAASLLLLGRISLLTRGCGLLLVTTCDAATLADPPPALAQLIENRYRIDLQPLSAADTHALLESLFGDAPGLEATASWLHELSRGSPQTCMQYAQYLVDQAVARYAAGRWQLPTNLRDSGLPQSVGAMLEQRMAALSEDARTLAIGLALARDQTRAIWQPETHVHIEDFPRLLDTPEPARAFAALDELLRVGLVQQRDGYYVVGQSAVADVLLRKTHVATHKPLHTRLAHIFEQPSYPQALWSSVRQFLLADDGVRARELIVAHAAALEHVATDWGAMRLSLMAECGVQAFEHWQTQRGAPLDGILLRRELLLICSVYDWRLARFGDSQLEQLSQDCGLSDWRALGPDLAPAERVAECLRRAQQAYDQAPAAMRGLSPPDALRELAGCALQLSGAFVNSHEVENAHALELVIAPLTALSPALALLAELCKLGYERVSGHEVFDKIMELGVTRLWATTGLPDALRVGGAGVHLHVQTVEDARRGNARAFSLMDLLASVIGDDMFLVVHGRWLSHAFRGDASNAKRLYKQVEMITEDDVWRRRAHLFAEAELHALVGDLRSLTRVSDRLRELADKFPGWLPWSAWARAEVHRLRGELPAAETALDFGLTHARAGDHRAWTRLAPSRAELRLAHGDVDGALREASAIVEMVDTLALDRSAAIAAERVRVLAYSQQGQHAQAAASLARAQTLASAIALGGLPLVRLHEAAARLALATGDVQACQDALEQMRALLEHAEAPALVSAYEALRADSRGLLHAPPLSAATSELRNGEPDRSTMFSEIQTRMSALGRAPERALEALELLLEDTGSTAGHLFLFGRSGLFEAASLHAADGCEETLAVATRYLESLLHDGSTQTQTVSASELMHDKALAPLPNTATGLAAVMLSDGQAQKPQLMGLALVAVGTKSARVPRDELVRAISRCLHAAGDSIGMALD